VRYYTMIRETHDMDDDYTHWIEYVAEGLLGSMERLRDQSRSAKGGLQEWTPKQKEFLALLKKGGILGSAELCRALNVTRARVNQLVTPLIASGAVIKEGRTRAARYRAK
jgi:DNA-binding MarR family transcriptional regulator